jgi:hypothetical protein
MKRPVANHLFILLVVWAFANDAWAAITVEPTDDAVASEDNVYLLVSSRPGKAGHPAFAERLDSAISVGLSLPTQSLPLSRPAPHRDSCRYRRLLVYLLMSLRR